MAEAVNTFGNRTMTTRTTVANVKDEDQRHDTCPAFSCNYHHLYSSYRKNNAAKSDRG